MSGSGCHGDHLPGTAVSASPEQLRHQEILPGLCVCSWGLASCLAAPCSVSTELPLGEAPGTTSSLPQWTLCPLSHQVAACQ